ncbi:transcriptional regulator [Serratia nevei]|nr:transcriptional regulator [Serratia nevei]MDK5935029.1 transcriptional regulator [Serratia nevei]
MKITFAKRLAHALRNERKKRNQSQSKTADSIGLKQATVSAFANNPDGNVVQTACCAELGTEGYPSWQVGDPKT